ncbi:MAG: 2-oxoacid:acceptor oxidoreductase subunit alpha, partial [Gammaproteobacteria bacterium]
FFGTTASPAYEALEILDAEGHAIDTCRLRAFPFTRDVEEFIESHDTVFVIEQNRDAQMRRLLLNESDVATREKLVSVLNYDGLPITARHIAAQIRGRLDGSNVTQMPRKREGIRRVSA